VVEVGDQRAVLNQKRIPRCEEHYYHDPELG
jgi:hypothetical protein